MQSLATCSPDGTGQGLSSQEGIACTKCKAAEEGIYELHGLYLSVSSPPRQAASTVAAAIKLPIVGRNCMDI